jgi:hypothetical protein
MSCQVCRANAPTKYVAFAQNIGAVIFCQQKYIKGEMCKKCIEKIFWQYTGITLILGWWSLFSLVIAPACLINNIVRYIGARNLPAAAPEPAYNAATVGQS